MADPADEQVSRRNGKNGTAGFLGLLSPKRAAKAETFVDWEGLKAETHEDLQNIYRENTMSYNASLDWSDITTMTSTYAMPKLTPKQEKFLMNIKETFNEDWEERLYTLCSEEFMGVDPAFPKFVNPNIFVDLGDDVF